MKRLFILSLCIVLPFVADAGNKFSISRDRLMDKIMGAWAAQTIGCAYGGPTEFRYMGRMIPDEVEIAWPEHQAKHYFDDDPGLYDDIYMDLTFLNILHEKGLNAPIDDFAQAFAYAPYPLWHANQAARFHILQGGKAPDSGHWRNNPHADDIDYQIEADYAGIICPGMPNSAGKLSDKIGHIMNYGDGWYGGVFVGAMYTLAYVMDDIPTIINEALKTIPRRSRFYRTIADVINWHNAYPNDWKRTWQLCQEKWADEVGCPDGVMSNFDIDASLNSAYIVIGLLYGHGDFGKTVEIATRCGQDSDCNPASAAGILGCIMGYSQIPGKWLRPLQEVEDRTFPYTKLSLQQTYQYSFDLALQIIKRDGGNIDGNLIEIRQQKPKAVRFEECFPKMLPAEVRDGALIDKIGTIQFDGTGIVVSNRVESARQDYVAEVEVILDGKPYATVHSPADFHDRTADLCWLYGLKSGSHTLDFRWLNPADDVKLHCTRIIIYKKK